MKTIVRINIDNSMNDLDINIENRNIVNLLNKIANNKGINNVRQLYTWNHGNNIVKCYGWYEGVDSTINKHELIPNGSSKFLEEDSSTILLYGDIFLLYYGDNNIIKDYSVSEYAEFTEIINEGFHDCDTDSNESECYEESTDGEYLSGDEGNSDIEHDFEIVSSDEDKELNLDDNNY